MALNNERLGKSLNTIQSAVLSICLIAAVAVAGCSQSDTSMPRQSESESAEERSTQGQVSQADTGAAARPEWVEASESWPDTLRFAFDSTEEVTLDGLLLRLRLTVSQDVTGLNFQDEKPVAAEVLMTVRPVPEWELARHLKADSLNLHDPVSGRDLPSLPMLSFQRTFDNETVRTQFLLNMAERYRISPDLEEGQPLEATLFLSWGERIIIVTYPAVKVEFMKEI